MPEIEWEGLKELEKLVEDMPAMAETPANKAMFAAITLLHGSIPEYPPATVGQKYIRTGTLGRRINGAVKTTDNTTIGVLGMLTPYAPWVVGDPPPGQVINGSWMFQKPLFKKRGWWRFNEVMENNTDKAWKEFQETFLVYFAQELKKHN